MIPSQPGNDDHDLEARLRGALHSGLDPVRSSVELTEPTIGRAHVIRRRRRTAATVAAAVAVVAVAAPITWSTLRKGGEAVPASSTTIASTTVPTSTLPSTPPPTSTSGQPPASTSEPDPVPTWENGTDSQRVVDVRQVDTAGRSTEAIWGDGSSLRRAGRTQDMPVTGFWDYTPLAGGRGILVDPFERLDQQPRVRVVDADGKELAEVATLADGEQVSVVADAAGERAVVYVHRGGSGDPRATAKIYLIDSRGTVQQSKDNLLHNLFPVGFVGDRFLISNFAKSKRTYSWDLATNVIDRYTDTGMATAVHEETQRATVLTYTSDDFMRGCVDIMDVSGPTGVVEAKTCGVLRPTAFSPDGRYVAAVDVYADGIGPGYLSVLDTQTGEVVLRLDHGTFFDEAFLPDGSLAARVTYQAGSKWQTTIMRCTLAGSCTRLVEPNVDEGGESGYRYRFFGSL